MGYRLLFINYWLIGDILYELNVVIFCASEPDFIDFISLIQRLNSQPLDDSNVCLINGYIYDEIVDLSVVYIWNV